jgi:RHS repeat-associated protein
MTYDPLNRLLTAQMQATSGQDCWGLNFGSGGLADDALGNLLSMSPSKCSGPNLSVSVNAKNQITSTGFSYDAAGNLTADGQYSYAYNAESEITSANGVNYTYDGDGLRVRKSSGTLYWRDSSGRVMEETDTSGNVQRDYIFFAGQRIAWRDSSGGVYYYFVDILGSTRVVTDSSGNACFNADYYPYGQENDYSTSCSPTYKFTGYEYDSETGNYYAYARYYDPLRGRFMSPDPLGGAVGNPQSLNRYAYVLNNPTSGTDPSGLLACRSWRCPSWLTGGGLDLASLFNGDGDFYGFDEFDLIDPNSFYNQYFYNWFLSSDWSPWDIQFNGILYGKSYSATFHTWNQYAAWSMYIGSLPESRCYESFLAIAQNQDLSDDSSYSVTCSSGTAGLTETATLNGHTLNLANLNGFWQDPISALHNGDASWYRGYFFNTAHVIASVPVSAHVDPFGPFNPFHYVIQLPLGWVSGPPQTATCSVNGGCTFGR